MTTDMDMRDMSALQVLRLMKDQSGKNLDEIAEMLEKDRQTVGGYFSESCKQFPPLPVLPKFCASLGSELILEWLQARTEQLKNGGLTPRPAPIGRTEALELGHMLQRSLANVMEAIFEAGNLQSKIVASDAAHIAGKIDRLIDDLVALRRRLQACRQDSYDDLHNKPLFRRCAPAGE